MELKEIIQIVFLIVLVNLIMDCMKNNKESFRYESLTGPNNIVLSDENGNLSSIQFPSGMIMLWRGLLTKIPQGWALCDGSQGTPDLRGRFVLGVNPIDNKNDLTVRPIGGSGGEEMHTLTIDEMPSHTHTTAMPNNLCNGSCPGGSNTRYAAYTTDWNNNYPANANNRDSTAVGKGQPHNVMPPFYTLAYIMKL